jgi:hypothetical protein
MTTATEGLASGAELLRGGGPQGGDLYFQGLLSKKLGADQLLDEELPGLIVEDPEFQALLDSYANGDHGRILVEATWLKLCSGGSVTTMPAGTVQAKTADEWMRYALWATVLEDPRFDLVWKRAMEETKLPPVATRGSWLAAVLALLKNLQAAGATSSLPLWGALAIGAAGGAGLHAALSPSPGTVEPKPPVNPFSVTNHVAVDMTPLQQPMNLIATDLSALKQSVDAIDGQKYQDIEARLTALENKIPPPGTSQADSTIINNMTNLDRTLNASYQAWDATLKQTNLLLDPNSPGRPATHADMTSLLKMIDEIDDGVGVRKADTALAAPPVPGVSPTAHSGRNSQIAQLLGADDPDAPWLKTVGLATVRTADSNDTLVKNTGSLNSAVNAYALVRSPLTSTKALKLNVPGEVIDHQGCKISFTPVEIGADSVKVNFAAAPCAARPASNGSLTVTRERKSVPGTLAEVAVESVGNTRIWPLPRTTSFLHSDVTLDLYSAP